MAWSKLDGGLADGTRYQVALYTGPASYTTGGETVNPATFGGQSVINVLIGGMPVGSSVGRLAAYDPVSQKIKIFTAAGTEADAASDQSSYQWSAYVSVR